MKLFFDELVAITAVSTDPLVLIKIVSMWNRVVGITSVKDALVGQPAIGLPTASHLLQCCLTQVHMQYTYIQYMGWSFNNGNRMLQTNAQLLENLDELIEDFKTEPVVDQHTKVLGNTYRHHGLISKTGRLTN